MNGDYLPPGPRAEPSETSIVSDWIKAEAACAASLARVAGRLGALDDRLRRGPEGWRHRLALLEAADLSWFLGDRVGPDRLALWISLRLSGVQDDTGALARLGWVVRRLTGGPGPEDDLSGFLDRRDPETIAAGAEPFADRASAWLDMMRAARALHPITRACMGFHLWHVAELSPVDDPLEAAVTAARVAIADLAPSGSAPGAIFAPIAMGGGGGFRAIGDPPARLARWLNAMESAAFAALRKLEEIEAWAAAAERTMAPLSGKTPPMLRDLFTSWPLVSVQLARKLTGAHRATVQRNIDWLEERGLIREVTGQGRYRMWQIVETRATEARSTSDRNDGLMVEALS